MKNTAIKLLVLLTLALSAPLLCTAADHPEHKTIFGPQGGKIIEVNDGSHAEFLIQKDRHVSVTFYSHEMKALPPAEQQITVTAQAPSGKVTLELKRTETGFVSQSALPDGDGYQLVFQIKNKPDAKPQNLRITVNLAECGECKFSEYACICDGHNH